MISGGCAPLQSRNRHDMCVRCNATNRKVSPSYPTFAAKNTGNAFRAFFAAGGQRAATNMISTSPFGFTRPASTVARAGNLSEKTVR